MKTPVYFPCEIISHQQEADETFRIRLRPRSETGYNFLPGQYCYLQFPDSETTKPFSIASAPEEQSIEFCIKTYGSFSLALSRLKPGDTLLLSEPSGSFVWNEAIKNASFLVGGIGISPIISMLSHINKTKQQAKLTLFYGNRTPATKAYSKELLALKKSLSLRVIDIYSDLDSTDEWTGYRGFLTREILQKEIENRSETVFFIVGPPIFLEKMKSTLAMMDVLQANIKTEIIA